MNSRKNSGLRACTAKYQGSAITQKRRMPGSQIVLKTTRKLTNRERHNTTITTQARNGATGPFGQRSQRHKDKKRREINSLASLVPGPPAKHAHAESRGQSHVHRCGPGVAGDARTRSHDQRAIHSHIRAGIVVRKSRRRAPAASHRTPKAAAQPSRSRQQFCTPPWPASNRVAASPARAGPRAQA